MESLPSLDDHADSTYDVKYRDKEDVMSGKSILVKKSRDEYPRAAGSRSSSKGNIQWEEGVVSHKRSKLQALSLMQARGSKWSYVHDILTKLKTEEAQVHEGDDSHRHQGLVSSKGFETYIRDIWFNMARVQSDKEVDLTLDQQTELEILKMKCKKENDRYLKRHPELSILLSLVYRKLFKILPDDPKTYVANYVHHLNLHRHELVLDEKEIPFDKPLTVQSEVETMSDSKERMEIEQLARDLLDSCVDIAAKGEAFVNVKNRMDSVLRRVSPSEDDKESIKSLRCAEKAIGSIISTLLTTTVLHNVRSSEIVVDRILDAVLQNVCPNVEEDSNVALKMRESIQVVVQSILKDITDNAELKIRERESGSLNEDTASIRSKGILRLNSTTRKDSREKVLVRAESKVKFQSLQ